MGEQPVVLYVEDDLRSCKIMKMLLKSRLKFEHVTILESSENFLAVVEAIEPKPTIIFLDIHVEPLSGFEMLDLLRQLDWAKDVPIVALTASVMNEEVYKLRLAGFSGCLAKPINLDTFPDAMTRILNGEVLWRIID